MMPDRSPLARAGVLLASAATAALLVSAPLAAQQTPRPPDEFASLAILPGTVTLDDARDSHRIAVIGALANGTTVDLTATADLRLTESSVATLSKDWVLQPKTDGATELVARTGGREARAKITVRGATTSPAVSFANEVIPVLTRSGCNAGSCHGSAAGKNGFRLSLFGFDRARDHLRLTRELRGRRVDRAEPEASLMLQKPTTGVAHKGGKRLAKGSEHYRLLYDWIASGAANDLEAATKLVGIELLPKAAVLEGTDLPLRMVVTARYADGSDRDVTDLALLSSSNEQTATLDNRGVLRSAEPGETFVMARFGTFAVVSHVLVRSPAGGFGWPADLKPFNYVDETVHAKLRKQRLLPAEVCDDATFVRRVYLDLINTLPSAEMAARFLADKMPDKRARLVDALLARPEFPDVWAMQWAEVLRIEESRLERKGMHVYAQYLREAFRDNKPFDQLVRELLTGQGNNFGNPAANFYVVSRDPKVLAENVAQVFLGVRVQCAQCHNHPFDRWTMDDYYGLAAFFTRVGVKRAEDPRERVVYPRGGGDIRHPVTNKIAVPTFLGGTAPKIARGGGPPRRPRGLADREGQPLVHRQHRQPRVPAGCSAEGWCRPSTTCGSATHPRIPSCTACSPPRSSNTATTCAN